MWILEIPVLSFQKLTLQKVSQIQLLKLLVSVYVHVNAVKFSL